MSESRLIWLVGKVCRKPLRLKVQLEGEHDDRICGIERELSFLVSHH
jgi:hypothetical protein